MSDQEHATLCKSRQIIRAIEWNLREGFLYCRIAQRFRKAFEDKLLAKTNPFNFGVFRACRDSAVLALQRIVDPPKSAGSETALLRHLLEYTKQHPEEYGNPDVNKIKRSVTEHEQYLKSDLFSRYKAAVQYGAGMGRRRC